MKININENNDIILLLILGNIQSLEGKYAFGIKQF
ncbi:MAG: hypothetical protein RLZ95_1497 [Bacteroidota bacterium]|jgi:hypothetical protein